MIQEIGSFESRKEYELRLLDHQLAKLLLPQLDVGAHLLHYLDAVLVWHLEIKQTQADRTNHIVQAVVLVDRLVN